MEHNFWLAKPYDLANHKLSSIQIYKILEKKTNYVLENCWWIRTLDPHSTATPKNSFIYPQFWKKEKTSLICKISQLEVVLLPNL